jgi:hypothetical protein
MRDPRQTDLVVEPQQQQQQQPRRVLIVGDGDLSYAAMMAPIYHAEGTQLTATVIEQKGQHFDTYTRGSENCTTIVNHGHQVVFGVDATKLEDTNFATTSFHVIRWNFPHWNGKTNNQQNRALLHSFFRSVSAASHLLRTTMGDGTMIELALMDHQGGANSSNLVDWKQSWQPALHAAHYGWVLVSVRDFTDVYPKSAYHRGGGNAAFRFHDHDAKLYTFARDRTTNVAVAVPKEFQLHCYYQMLFRNDDADDDDTTTNNTTTSGEEQCHDELQGHILRMLPTGWKVEVVMKKQWTQSQFNHHQDNNNNNNNNNTITTAYWVAFFGESKAMTQKEADKYRIVVEREMSRLYPLHYLPPRRQWPISNPIPASLCCLFSSLPSMKKM